MRYVRFLWEDGLPEPVTYTKEQKADLHLRLLEVGDAAGWLHIDIIVREATQTPPLSRL